MGERIAVFIDRSGARTTRVEVFMVPLIAPLNFSPDWQSILLEGIGSELGTGK